MTTIEDVARMAGVSTATVSRVLNGTAIVSAKTEKKVRNAIKTCHYHANMLGSGLRSRSTKTVLCIVSTISNSFYAKVIKGIEDEAEANGYRVLVGTNYDSEEREDSYLTLVRNRLADGVILMRPSISDAALGDLAASFPVVQCDCPSRLASIPFVSIDNRKAAREMTERLIASGHRKIALLRVPDGYAVAEERFKGYRDALEGAGIPFSDELVLEGNYGYRNAKEVVSAFLETERPDAIFAFSDRMAAGAMAAAREKGLSVPEDISLAGFDNIDLSYMMDPPLTTVSQNQYRMGVMAMQKLLSLMRDNKSEESTYIDYEIKWRASVADRTNK
ncbi:MAG: LacI family transcriptional regulator [Ruminococcaceae bacterium]|nr:LacI family transcriptional regulator [Oscillospiraceae bacterium]